MDEREEFWRSFNEELQKIAPEHRDEAVQHFFSIAVRTMNDVQIRSFRSRLAALVGEDHECVEVVDGQLALREIQSKN